MSLSNPLPRPAGEGDEVHRRLMRVVREHARTGDPLPGEYDLAARLGATRQQLRRALTELERLGVVRPRRQGAATTVDPVALRMSVRLEDQFEHSELIARLGYSPAVEVLEAAPTPLPAPVAVILEADEGAPSVRLRKRWTADGSPVMYADGYLLVPDMTPRELDDSVFVAVNQVWGEPLIWDVASPGAAAVDDEQAKLLGIAAGDPVMTLELVGIAASGRRLFYTEELHRPDFIRYSFVRTVRPPWSIL